MSPLQLEVRDYVAIVTMDNPPVNASEPDWDFQGTFDSFGDRDDVRVAIFTAAGQRVFSPGANIGRTASEGGPPREPGAYAGGQRRGRENFNAIVDCQVPVIGAINGHALGGGLALAASCDFLIASEKATFGLPEVDVGLLGGARHFMRLFGNQWTRYANLTCQRISAADAYRLGAVIRVVPPDDLMDTAMDVARAIAEKSPISVRMAKANLNAIEHMDLKNGYRYEQTQTAILQKTEDALEAKRAWAEKRKPVWKGR